MSLIDGAALVILALVFLVGLAGFIAQALREEAAVEERAEMERRG